MDAGEAAAALEDIGFVVLENIITPDVAGGLDARSRAAVADWAAGTGAWLDGGYLSLEGAINRVPELATLVEHPLCLEIAELVLGTSSFEQYNNIALKWCRPGLGEGGLHADCETPREPGWRTTLRPRPAHLSLPCLVHRAAEPDPPAVAEGLPNAAG